MRSSWHDPLSTFYDAATSAVGWLVTICLTSLLGLWLGWWIGFGQLPSVELIACGAMILVLAPLMFPHLFLLYGITFLLWYVPHRFESLDSNGLRLGAAVANLLAWLGSWVIVGLAFSDSLLHLYV